MEARAALIEFLKGGDVTRPPRIDVPPKDEASVAVVTSTFELGTITLAGPAGDLTLVWDGTVEDRRRGLEPGSYRLRSTRLMRPRGHDDWFLSATGPPGKAVPYEPGRTRTLTVEGDVYFTAVVRRRRGGLQLGMKIQDAVGRGLSVYENMVRAVVAYAVLDGQGKELTSGSMNYG